MSVKVIGVDLGGTQIRASRANDAGLLESRSATLTQAPEGPEAVIERICEQVTLAAEGQEFAAIGIGAPGPTDPYAGTVLMGPNLPGWHNVPLQRILTERFAVPTYLGNDANLAGLAEHRYGAGRDSQHMIYITQSTGIGGGLISGGRMLLGRHGLAGEIGHITIDLHGEDAGDHVKGTLEGTASGPNVARRARTALHHGAHSILQQWVGPDIEQVTPQMLVEAAEQGDDFALSQWRATGRYLGVGIVSLLHVFNPQRIVIGGSVWLHANQFMHASLWETIRTRCESPEYWRELEIVSAALGGDVGLLGAVALAIDELGT